MSSTSLSAAHSLSSSQVAAASGDGPTARDYSNRTASSMSASPLRPRTPFRGPNTPSQISQSFDVPNSPSSSAIPPPTPDDAARRLAIRLLMGTKPSAECLSPSRTPRGGGGGRSESRGERTHWRSFSMKERREGRDDWSARIVAENTGESPRGRVGARSPAPEGSWRLMSARGGMRGNSSTDLAGYARMRGDGAAEAAASGGEEDSADDSEMDEWGRVGGMGANGEGEDGEEDDEGEEEDDEEPETHWRRSSSSSTRLNSSGGGDGGGGGGGGGGADWDGEEVTIRVGSKWFPISTLASVPPSQSPPPPPAVADSFHDRVHLAEERHRQLQLQHQQQQQEKKHREQQQQEEEKQKKADISRVRSFLETLQRPKTAPASRAAVAAVNGGSISSAVESGKSGNGRNTAVSNAALNGASSGKSGRTYQQSNLSHRQDLDGSNRHGGSIMRLESDTSDDGGADVAERMDTSSTDGVGGGATGRRGGSNSSDSSSDGSPRSAAATTEEVWVLSKQVAVLQQQLADASAANCELLDRVEHKSQALAEAEARLKDMQQSLRGMEAASRDVEAKLRDARAEVHSLREAQAERDAACAERDAMAAEMEAALSSWSRALEEAKDARDEAREAAEAAAAARQKLAEAEAENKRLWQVMDLLMAQQKARGGGGGGGGGAGVGGGGGGKAFLDALARQEGGNGSGASGGGMSAAGLRSVLESLRAASGTDSHRSSPTRSAADCYSRPATAAAAASALAAAGSAARAAAAAGSAAGSGVGGGRSMGSGGGSMDVQQQLQALLLQRQQRQQKQQQQQQQQMQMQQLQQQEQGEEQIYLMNNQQQQDCQQQQQQHQEYQQQHWHEENAYTGSSSSSSSRPNKPSTTPRLSSLPTHAYPPGAAAAAGDSVVRGRYASVRVSVAGSAAGGGGGEVRGVCGAPAVGRSSSGGIAGSVAGGIAGGFGGSRIARQQVQQRGGARLGYGESSAAAAVVPDAMRVAGLEKGMFCAC
ncbi:unnamed protein product [Closterium sp. NIES-53]